MAHFAELNEENVVLRVTVIHNNEMLDEDGNEQESNGVEFLQSLYGEDTIWKQCSYNTYGNKYWVMEMQEDNFEKKVEGDQSKVFRGNYPAEDYIYDSENDVFVAPEPDEDYTLNEETWLWEQDER
jgi:hypothetical protein